ncbi:MAG: hypothetical protein WCF10_14960 [Polyangiales bacterium]
MRKHAGIWIACLTVTGALAVWTRADGYQISALSDDLLNITHTSSGSIGGGDDVGGSSAGSSAGTDEGGSKGSDKSSSKGSDKNDSAGSDKSSSKGSSGK